MRRLMTAAACAMLLMSPVVAQTGNPAGMAPGTPEAKPGVPAPHQPNTADRVFVIQAATGGLAEVEFGQLVDRKSQNAAVKDFARRMVQDHTRANEQLMSLARQDNIALSSTLDAEHQAARANLEKLSGAPFDLAYIDGQVQDHQKTAQLLEWEIGSGQDPAFKMLAAEMLPTVFDHLQKAQDLKSRLTGTGPQGVSASPSTTGGVPQ